MNRIITYLITAIVLTGALTACNGKRTYRIGVSQCSQDDWRTKMNEEIQREIILHPEAEVEIRSADDSNEKQIADIHYYMEYGFDIIIAAPNEADAITPVIEEAYSAGIPVVIFDRDINGHSYTARQGVDNYAIGKAAAEYARHLTGSGGKILEIYGLPGSTPAIERHNGFRDGAASEGLTVLGAGIGNWNGDDAAKVTDSLLNIYKDVDLIFAHNDRMAIAASETARHHGLKLKVIGIDAAPEIGIRAVADSIIDATFLYPTEGYRLIRLALDILKGQKYEKEATLPLASAVDKTNADILLLQNESLKEETAKIKLLKTQVDDYWDRHSAQTTLFYAAIAILVLLFGFLFLLLRAFWQRKRHQATLMEQNRLLEEQRDTQRELNRQLSAATQSKLMFFTNVSHDLRTPLTLISEPVEQLAEAQNLTPQQQTLARIARKNVKILRRLINQILDFRKYENGKLDIHPEEVAVAPLFRDWAEAFTAVARVRHIKLGINIELPDTFSMAIDLEKIERVCFNLLSNAFKYTPDNGHIDFTCSQNDDILTISVKDTGKGIAADDLRNIFDRFYQVDKIHPNGSGIGLSLAKAFVELHKGVITVDSTPGKGSTFTVTLPVTHTSVKPESPHISKITAQDVESELGVIEPEVPLPAVDMADESKPLLLVVDDNDDIRRMVSELLNDSYRIITAENGREGIRLAVKYVPDLIICDVMMPEMDGLECCRRIKEEVSTSHIPVLMLTACSMDEQRVQGYDSGADGYISKPFSNAVLRSRCASLIANRIRIKELFRGSNITEAAKPDSTAAMPIPATVENEFYARFIKNVEEHMSDPELNVDMLASEMGLGRSQLYRKIKALTNYSPVELIRNIRLKHAREQLLTTSRTISEIAYESGFSTPAYFTKCYREVYGETPSELRERTGQKK
ncbi:MAG: substrate-binding domain-containing protein [Muribaculaceae bacterium]|nr:substrate-binding domain-containing protein [Muribaculaceae bacterium]